MLTKFDLASIAHGKAGTQYRNLSEIWLIRLKYMNANRKRLFIASLPKLIEFLCVIEVPPSESWSPWTLRYINELSEALVLNE